MLALEEKGIISQQEVEKVAKRLVDSFRLKNILTPQEFKEVRKALRKMKVPDLLVTLTGYLNRIDLTNPLPEPKRKK